MCKINCKSIATWVLLGVLVIIFLISSFKFITVSRGCIDTINRSECIHQHPQCKCHNPSSKCSRGDIESPPDIEISQFTDYIFDSNVLTFLVSVAIVAILSLLMSEREKLEKTTISIITEFNNAKQKWESDKIILTNFMSQEKEKLVNERNLWEQERKNWNVLKDELQLSFKKEIVIQKYIRFSESISSDATTFSSTIISTGFKNHILPSIEASRSRIYEFNNSIPSYNSSCGQLKDESILSNDEITSITKPLYFAEGCIEDLISQARHHFRNNLTKQIEFSTELSPLRDDIRSLIEKFEEFREAPINRI